MAIFSTALTLLQAESGTSAGTGTIATSGTTVTGTTTNFTTETPPGSVIVVNGNRRIVTAVASATSMTIHQAFSPDVSAGASFAYATWSEVVNASDLNGPTQSAAQVDTSNFSDLGFGSQIAGLRQPGSVSFNLFYQPRNSIHAALQTDFDAGNVIGWRVWLPDSDDLSATPPPDDANSVIAWVGSISEFAPAAATNDAWKASVSVILASKPVVIAGAGT